MQPYQFTSARELFEAAREASRDAERIRRQLDAMEQRALSLGGGMGERVSSTGEPDRMGGRVAALVDMEATLRERQEVDYALLDLACAVLYGPANKGGLAALVPTWWADVLWWRYLDGSTWEQVAEAVGYSPRRCFDVAQTALEVADYYGLARTRQGMGSADERANKTPANEPERAREQDAGQREREENDGDTGGREYGGA